MALRFGFAALVLLPFVLVRRRVKQAQAGAGQNLYPTTSIGFRVSLSPRHLVTSSLLIGIALFAGYAFQTAGLHLTTPAKAGFITGLSVVIVPVVAALWLRQAPERNAWLGVGLAMVGLALLCLQNGLAIAPGDLLVFCCALGLRRTHPADRPLRAAVRPCAAHVRADRRGDAAERGRSAAVRRAAIRWS